MTKKILFALCLTEFVLLQAACFETSPQGCDTQELDDGSVVLVCGDDTPVTITGPKGEQGEPGEAGEQGVDGLTTALRVEDATSEQCMFGGTVVFSGADADADGELDADEEQGSFVVCQGVPGDATAPTIVTSDADAVSCPTGGKQLDVGVDLDQSMSLEANEITQSFVVCNGDAGANGLASLVNVTVDGAVGCDGDLVETGVDADASGTLEGAEVQTSFEVCDGVDGLTPIIRVNEGAAVTCAQSGDVLDFGLDADANGTLEAGEVSASFEVCDGVNGMDGMNGTNGVDGMNGSNGVDGMNGMNGMNGTNGVDGMNGTNGMDGMNGTNGMDGMNGMSGFSALIRLTPEPGGVNCQNGGQLIEAGVDNGDGGGTASNGTLEPGEIDSSSYVCNGQTSSANGKNSLIRTSQEPAGVNCPDGGIKLEAGLDNDSSGTLENSEVDSAQTQYLCTQTRVVALRSSLGGLHSCALTSGGAVWCWGRNDSGQLGDGTTIERPNPVRVSGITGATGLGLGTSHTCAALADGSVQCWGENGNGQLGNASTTDSPTPVSVTGLTGVVSLGLGGTHSCAQRGDGTVACWGGNNNGQLGNGTNTASSTFVEVAGLTGATSVSGGFGHTCAVAGVVKRATCWGFNVFGQLGDGTTTSSNTPVTVSALTDEVTLITTGGLHSCAVTNLGEVFCWGGNSNGQIGTGFAGPSTTAPLQLALTGISSIASGTAHSCAGSSSGGIKCWGWNNEGQLGDGTNTDRDTPVDTFGISTAVDVSAGGSHSCTLLSSEQIKCWGDNSNGQLGNGSTNSSAVPTTTIF